MKITKLSSTQDGNRVNIYLDDKYALTVENKLVLDYSLYVGLEITEDITKELQQNDLQERFYRKALEKAGSRPYSKFEIQNYLMRSIHRFIQKRGKSMDIDMPSIIKTIISKMDRYGYLNDKEYAVWITGIKKTKKSGPEMRTILMSKGVDRKIIDEILEENDFSNTDLVVKLIDKKQRSLEGKKLDKREVEKKIIESLMRKGYKYDEIKKLL